jgi:hypothetical protein
MTAIRAKIDFIDLPRLFFCDHSACSGPQKARGAQS